MEANPTTTIALKAVPVSLPLAAEAARVARRRVSPDLGGLLAQLAEQIMAEHDAQAARKH
jgi:hypothetical protein